jgi:hypothetical protein
MKMIHGISTIFLIIGFLLAPGCVFAAVNDYSTDSGLSFQPEKINPLEKGGGGKGGSSSGSSSAKKVDFDDEGGDATGGDDGGWGWIIFLMIIIVLLAVAFIVYWVYFRK